MKEKIAKKIYMNWNKDSEFTWEKLPEHRKDTYREWVDVEILSLETDTTKIVVISKITGKVINNETERL